MHNLPEKNIYIIRHGETDLNKMNIVQGSSVDTSLNETGISQAKQFYEAYKHISFDKVYLSALKRTQQSVQAFIDSGIPFEKLKELNEICWGDIEGKKQTPEQKALYWDIVHRWNAGDVQARPSGGESPVEVMERQKVAIHHIMQQDHEKNILVCMHGRAMKILLCHLLHESLDHMETYQHSNLCLYLLKHSSQGFQIIKYNDSSHLNNPSG